MKVCVFFFLCLFFVFNFTFWIFVFTHSLVPTSVTLSFPFSLLSLVQFIISSDNIICVHCTMYMYMIRETMLNGCMYIYHLLLLHWQRVCISPTLISLSLSRSFFLCVCLKRSSAYLMMIWFKVWIINSSVPLAVQRNDLA